MSILKKKKPINVGDRVICLEDDVEGATVYVGDILTVTKVKYNGAMIHTDCPRDEHRQKRGEYWEFSYPNRELLLMTKDVEAKIAKSGIGSVINIKPKTGVKFEDKYKDKLSKLREVYGIKV